MTLPKVSEQRRKKRKQIDHHIAVMDSVLETGVGQLVNINEHGFMLIGGGQVREDCVYQLSITLDVGADKQEKLCFGAECLWVRETESGTQYWAGFQIIDISDEDRARISTLIC